MPRMMIVWITATMPVWSTCETIRALRRVGVARKRWITPRSRSSIIDMPDQVAPKNAVMTTIPGVRNWT